MTDSQCWMSADINQSWHCFKTSNHDTCQPQSRTPSTLPPTHTHTVAVCTSIAIIHQIYLHWSRAKIKPAPLPPTHLTPSAPAKSNHSSILAVIDWLPIQLNLSQMEVGVGGWAALLKAIRHWHWQEGEGGQKREKRDGRRREVIERD